MIKKAKAELTPDVFKKYSKQELAQAFEAVGTMLFIALEALKGCKKHRDYRGIKPPKVKCEDCDFIFKARMALEGFVEGLTTEEKPNKEDFKIIVGTTKVK